jgi:hypothetical protein
MSEGNEFLANPRYEEAMKRVLMLCFRELVVIVTAVALISGAYILLLRQHRTYAVFVVGLMLVAIVSGYVARVARPDGRVLGWFFLITMSAIVTVMTLLLSLFLIVNIRGA